MGEVRTMLESGMCAIMALASCLYASSSVGSSSNTPPTLFCTTEVPVDFRPDLKLCEVKALPTILLMCLMPVEY